MDGKPDLAIGHSNAGMVSVLLNVGAEIFPSYEHEANRSIAVAPADLNGDGWLDLIVSRGDGSVEVMLNDGNVAPAAGATYPGGGWMPAMAPADFDGDGQIDLAITDDHAVSVLPNQGAGA